MLIKNILKLAVFPTVLLFTACDSFLDVVPKGVVIPQTLADYEALLSAPLVVTRTSNNTLYATDEVYLPEAYRASTAGYPGRHALNTYDYLPEHYDISEDDADWNVAYKAIYTFNSVVQGIAENKEGDINKKNRILGEALMHRGFTYLTLVNQYAKHYSSTASQDLGVPLPLKPDINALLRRSTVAEVYAQIEKDLLASVDLLPVKPTFNSRPSKPAALGLLSRMYLYQGNWQKAYDYATEALGMNNFLYDYNGFEFANLANKNGAIIGYSSVQNDKKHVIFQKYQQKVGAFDFKYLMSPEQLALYQKGDLRKYFGSSENGYGSDVLLGQGVLERNGPYDYNNAGVITQELYLIRAESAARLNKLPEALQSLNTLRKNRFTTETFTELTSGDKQQVLDWTLAERRVELAYLGLRLADIKRLNLEGRNITIKRDNKIIGSNDPLLVFPIPSKNIDINKNLIQNPRQ